MCDDPLPKGVCSTMHVAALESWRPTNLALLDFFFCLVGTVAWKTKQKKKTGRGGAHYNSLPNIPCIGILEYFHFYCMAILYPAPTNTHIHTTHIYTHTSHTHHTYMHSQDIDCIIHSSCSIACLVQYVQVHTFSLRHIWCSYSYMTCL